MSGFCNVSSKQEKENIIYQNLGGKCAGHIETVYIYSCQQEVLCITSRIYLMANERGTSMIKDITAEMYYIKWVDQKYWICYINSYHSWSRSKIRISYSQNLGIVPSKILRKSLKKWGKMEHWVIAYHCSMLVPSTWQLFFKKSYHSWSRSKIYFN